MSESSGVDIAFHDVPVPLALVFCRLADQQDNGEFWKSIRDAFKLATELLQAAKLDPEQRHDKDMARWMSGLADSAHEMVEELSLWGRVEDGIETKFRELFYRDDREGDDQPHISEEEMRL